MNRAKTTVQAYASRLWSLLNEGYNDAVDGDALNLKLLSLVDNEAEDSAASSPTHAGAPHPASGFVLQHAVLHLPLQSDQLERWFDFVNVDRNTGLALPADEQLSRSSIYSMINAINCLHDLHKTRVLPGVEVLFKQVRLHHHRAAGYGGAHKTNNG